MTGLTFLYLILSSKNSLIEWYDFAIGHSRKPKINHRNKNIEKRITKALSETNVLPNCSSTADQQHARMFGICLPYRVSDK